MTFGIYGMVQVLPLWSTAERIAGVTENFSTENSYR